MRKVKLYMVIILAGSMLASCTQGSSGADPVDETATVSVVVAVPVSKTSGSLSKAKGPGTRAFSEESVSDLHVLIGSSDGQITGNAYSLGNSLSVKSKHSGPNFTVYAIINTEDEHFSLSGGMPTTQESLKAMVTPDITGVNDLKSNDHLVMSGSLTTTIVPAENAIDHLSVSRLAARNILNITCQDHIELTGYIIGNLPVRSWYIAHPNTNESTISDEAVGTDAVDVAKSADWLTSGFFAASGIATGSTPQYGFTFYMYENRRGGRKTIGGITGDASNQSQKVLYAPDRATYVDLYANANGTSVTYRLYLGADMLTNYNVKRNASYTYNITVASKGMTVGSVTIDPWGEVSGGDAEL